MRFRVRSTFHNGKQRAIERTAAPPVATFVATVGHNSRRSVKGTVARQIQIVWCPRQESNLGTWFRKPMLYPLSYGGVSKLRAPISATGAVVARRDGSGRRTRAHLTRSRALDR